MSTGEKKIAEEMKFDLRTIEMKLRRNEITREEYEAYVKKLSNDEFKADYIDVYEEPSGDEPTPHVEKLTFS